MKDNILSGCRYTGRVIVAGLLFFLITGDVLWVERMPAPEPVPSEKAEIFSHRAGSVRQTDVYYPEIDGRRVLHF